MTTGGLLSQLAAAAGVLAALVLLYLLARALWAEIGPMVSLLFRRDRMAALDEDDKLKH